MKVKMVVEIYGLGDEGQVPDPTKAELESIEKKLHEELMKITDEYSHVCYGVIWANEMLTIDQGRKR
jgi:hypothetical protein